MTFETEEGVNRALSYDDAIEDDENLKDLKYWIDTHEIEIQEASEPSDIIWENRHFTPADRNKKACIVYTIMFLMLTASFIVIFICSDVSATALAKYPLVADCTLLAGYDDPHTMEQNTIMEYRSNQALEAQGFHVSYSKGYVVCFCTDKMEAGDTPEQLYGS